MTIEYPGQLVDLEYEGKMLQLRLAEPLSCGNYEQLELTGTVFDSFPRQFEVNCRCGCGYSSFACLTSEEQQIEQQR